MSKITTEELVKSICKLCKIPRTREEEGRVFSKEELLLIQANIIKLQQNEISFASRKVEIKDIVQKTIEELTTKGVTDGEA